MSHGIKKETYVEADEKTTKSLTYDLLDNLYVEMKQTNEFHVDHMKNCGTRFATIENRKKKDTAIAAASGTVGGSITIIGLWFKKTFLGG